MEDIPRQVKRAARRIACIGIAFHLALSYMESAERDVEVGISCDGTIPLIRIVDRGGCSEPLDDFRRGVEKTLRVPVIEYSVECANDGWGVSIDHLLDQAEKVVAKDLVPWAANLAQRRVEYFVLLGWNGEVAVGAGSEDKVELPSIPGTYFIHTHPNSTCYPSWRDLESAADFMAQGGLGEVIVSRSCWSAIRLQGPFLEDDYWTLLDVARCAKSASARKDGTESYLRCLSRLGFLRSVRFRVG
ncbi:MAG: hypothetical protein ABWW70_08155 [Thermoproteota archaeon]